jgi:hypothetical protein
MKAYSFLNKILIDGGSPDAINMALKGEIDYLQGRNEELRHIILQQKNDLNNVQKNLIKAQDDVIHSTPMPKILNIC